MTTQERACPYRHTAIQRNEAMPAAFQRLPGVVDEVFPVERLDVERAKHVLLGAVKVSAPDTMHIAVMERRGVMRILSFDSGFNEFPGIARLPR